MRPILRLLTSLPILFTVVSILSAAEWETVKSAGKFHPRHEAAFVECDGKFYLLGGRRIKPVDIYDPATGAWTQGSAPPLEVHHFQPVVWQGRILMAGAMTGRYPHETGLPRVLEYHPASDSWNWGAEIPEDRRRGGAGAVIHDGKLLLVAGIIDGHWTGNVAWFDAFDLTTGEWIRLPDAPRARDHFQVGVIGDRLYAGGGRRTSGITKEVFNLTVPELDIFDFTTGRWTTASDPLPTPRAGCFSLTIGPRYLVAGGESVSQQVAHSEVEAYDVTLGRWVKLPSFQRGRHGTSLILHGGFLHTCSGSGSRGGRPELDSMERLPWNDWDRGPGSSSP